VIPLAEINRFAEHFHVAAETIEKDYVISWILLCLSNSRIGKDFIFYGGTAIKRVYFEDHRFSEDIDLISSKKSPVDALLNDLKNALTYARDEANLLLQVNEANVIVGQDRLQVYITYSAYDEIVGSAKEIRIDFSMNMRLSGMADNKKIIKTYSDTKGHNQSLSVMSLNTILANKLGMLFDLTRNEPRDLFDIHYLLQRADRFDLNINHVSKIFEEKYGYTPTLALLKSNLNNNKFKINWHARLYKQVADLPDIHAVIQEIDVRLSALFERLDTRN
jgi:predicted nucleotidyltransferase component of viral defense system